MAAGYPSRPPDRLELIGSKASATFEDSELRLHGASPRSQHYDSQRGYQASFDGAIAHFVDCLERVTVRDQPRRQSRNAAPGRHAYWSAGLNGLRGRS